MNVPRWKTPKLGISGCFLIIHGYEMTPGLPLSYGYPPKDARQSDLDGWTGRKPISIDRYCTAPSAFLAESCEWLLRQLRSKNY